MYISKKQRGTWWWCIILVCENMSKDLYSSIQCPGGQQPAASSLVRVENIQLLIIAISLRCGRALHDCLQEEEEARGEQGQGQGQGQG